MKLAFARKHPVATAGIVLSLSVMAGAEAWVAREPVSAVAALGLAGDLHSNETRATFAQSRSDASVGAARPIGDFDRSQVPERVFQSSSDGVVEDRSAITEITPPEPAGRVADSTGHRANASLLPPAPETLEQAPLPLVLQMAEHTESANAPTPSQADALAALRQDFLSAIGGANQDPNDPAYLQRWLRAERESDEQFRLLFGNSAFLAFQMATNGE